MPMNCSPTLICTVALLAAATAGCGATLQVPSCPNPVLLGPVDRVGGHRMEDAIEVTTVKGEAELAINIYASVQGSSIRSDTFGKERLGLDAVERTEGRVDRDVRVKRLPVGAWALHLAGFHSSQWAGVEGQIVEVRRGR